ncbi:GIN4 [Candida metapsilosis]|uniref:non-specific serine/threonine protein kinase n=1 Tax=Candida metapsilosis TaxID=273372 RepID=A0A8H7ZEI9_9ASCO|nr:GIN4 [Candida metapsilosis]
MVHSRSASITSSIASTGANHNHPQSIGPWKLGKTLGRGATGRVLLATHQLTGQKAAVKVVSKSELREEDEHGHGQGGDATAPKNGEGLPYGIEREIIIMKLLTHPNVLRLYDVWETSKALYLVLEYVEGGELFDLLVEMGPLQEPEAIKYFRQIILGTAYCHALGICHRDLKPENLLLDAQLNVKLADFGMAALESNGKLLDTSCGSPHYAAPEIVSGLKYHGAASDVWSCGVILFALLTGRLPFDDENIRNLLLKVQAGSYEMPPNDEISREAQDLIKKMLEVDPVKRITTENILKHPLLTKYPMSNEDLISEKSLPHPETAYKSLGSVKNIDKQILSNLSILWNDRPESDIIKCLLSHGPNPEKTFYALLLRYRHSGDDQQQQPPSKSSSFNNRISRSSSINRSPAGRKRTSQISVSRPTSFQYKNGFGGSSGSNTRLSHVRLSAASSANNSPRKMVKKRSSFARSPSSSPIKSRSKQPQSSNIKATPRNIYNDIIESQSHQSVAPTLPSKDSYLNEKMEGLPKLAENPVVDESPNLSQPANRASTASKRSSMVTKNNTNSKRMSKRRSIRASMTAGLKRNSVTMKMLSIYTKLAGDDEWEYMDKSAKRTSATFAALCDKIFNQEDYNEQDEELVDQEELEAREYERLMEIERKKHEAELKARRELEKKKRRSKRKSLLSSRKLSFIIREDNPSGDSHMETIDEQEITQPKRQSKHLGALRALSEGQAKSDELTMDDVEQLKRRSVSQPVRRRTLTPILTRRPVSRLDPLWQAHHNEQIERAQDALEREWRDNQKKDRDSKMSKKKINRESMVSVMDDIAEDDGGVLDKRRPSKDSYYDENQDFELPEPDVVDSNLSDEYMSEIRKSRLLNSQRSLHRKAGRGHNEPETLISGVKIPTVTRKSRHFSNSNKRLSVLSMYSTKDSYRDLNSIIESHAPDNANDDDDDDAPIPPLKTSFADRLDKAGLPAEDEELGDDGNSVMDFEQHLADKRHSYYDSSNKRVSRASTTRRYSKSARPQSKVPDLPTEDSEYTFNSKGEPTPKKHQKKESTESNQSDDVFDKIKLPDGKSSKSSIDVLANGSSHKQNNAGKSSMVPAVPEKKSQHETRPMSKVRDPKTNGPQAKVVAPAPPPPPHKKPLDDKTNNYPEQNNKPRKGSFLRIFSRGSKKSTDEGSRSASGNNQLPSPTESNEEKPKSSFLRWFSSSSHSPAISDSEIKRFATLLPREEMQSALFTLLKSWSNFGLKDLKNDTLSYTITGAISKYNSFDLKSCKFRIRVAPRDFNHKSEIICARIKGSKVTTDTLFNEIEKVLEKEGVMDR